MTIKNPSAYYKRLDELASIYFSHSYYYSIIHFSIYEPLLKPLPLV